MIKRKFPVVTVTDRCFKRVSLADPRVFDNEITACDDCPDGAVVDVISEKGRYVGSGFINRNSKITVRIISRNANDRFDDDFFRRRVGHAYEYRKKVMTAEDMTACRLIFGDADLFPGLTVDRFNDLLSVQVLCLGTEQRQKVILDELLRLLTEDGAYIRGVYLRNESEQRLLEGMEQNKGPYWWRDDPSTNTVISENGIKYHVDVENGQKTGFFLDQKYNRRAAALLARGRTVLDCCTHTGSFALNCKAGGAGHVTAIDVSASAIEMTRANAELNGLDIDTECDDVFHALQRRIEEHDRSADFIILDPPAFTKSARTRGNAMNGYRELNTLAMRLLPRGGLLATASCSHFVTHEDFRAMLADSAKAAGVDLRLIEQRRQSPDHPIVLGSVQSDYLKFYTLQII